LVVKAERKQRDGFGHASQPTTSEAESTGGGGSTRLDPDDLSRFEATGLQWESIARHRTVVVLPAKHPLVSKRQVKLGELETMFFVGMSEKTHPGFRDWLNGMCQQAGFTPRVLQDAELEPALMTFVAEGLGVTLAREHIKRLPHPGVAFRPVVAARTIGGQVRRP
jgi:DNA-binding transcriptional LysR family regulator